MPNTIVFKKNLLSQAIHQSFMQFSMGGRLSTKEITMKEHSHSSQVQDLALLDRTRQVRSMLEETSELPDTRPVMQRRFQAHDDKLESLSKLLLKRDYKIVFIGSIGVGKSTAICRTLGLTTSDSKSVLETGAGGTTICEVQIIESHAYGIQTTPCTVDELRSHAQDFADYLLAATKTEIEDANPDSQGISKEVERALRNMSGLKIRREKQEDGKTLSIDEAKELAKQFTSVRELTMKIMELIGLHKRDCNEIWCDDSEDQEPLEWLRVNFAKINNGRHSDFSLPKLIEVIVPFELLSHHECSSVRVIDTKGIDGTAVTRADLNCHLGDPHTLTVLCTPFNDAPAAAPQLILEGAKKRGVPSLSLNTLLLVLPRPEEALAEKYDDSGECVESSKIGYELKHEKIQAKLVPLGLDDLPIYCFNSREDDAEALQDVMNNHLTAMRENLRQQLINEIQAVENVLANYKEIQFEATQLHASKMLQAGIDTNRAISLPSMLIHDGLIDGIKIINAGKVRAAIGFMSGNGNRYKSPDLDYYHYLENGTDLLASSLLHNKLIGFSGHCKALANNPEFLEAKELINQADSVLWGSYEHLKAAIKPKSRELFATELLNFAAELWDKSGQEWGRKKADLEDTVKNLSYRERVARHHKEWFADQRRVELEQQIYALIISEWQSALDKVSALLETEEE